MIQINLIPDVKRELLLAKRQRAMVVSGAVLASVVLVAGVVLMAVYAFGVQALLLSTTSKSVDQREKELLSVEDVSQSLTLQNQLRLISSTHDNKLITSNLFATFIQLQVPNVTISDISLSSEEGKITVSAESRAGFNAVERFTKTLQATQLKYTQDSKDVTVPLATEIIPGERNFGKDENNGTVVRFMLSFAYDPILFQRGVERLTVVGPDRTKATDSFEDIPKGLFKESTVVPESEEQ